MSESPLGAAAGISAAAAPSSSRVVTRVARAYLMCCSRRRRNASLQRSGWRRSGGRGEGTRLDALGGRAAGPGGRLTGADPVDKSGAAWWRLRQALRLSELGVPGYDVVELLGYGSGGEVWLGRERATGLPVALEAGASRRRPGRA